MRILFAFCLLAASAVDAAQPPAKWVVSWAASVQGPYPSGNPSAQPDLKLAFPEPERGARDQSFRMIVKPALWGRETRIRFSNALGAKDVTIDGVFVGLHLGSSAVVAGTSRQLTFAGKHSVTVAPGVSVWSDAVSLPFASDPDSPHLTGRKLAISFHVGGESGPITWHAKALQTSYVSFPWSGPVGHEEAESAFALSTTSWYFIDALDMKVPGDAYAIVAFGDSITDGTLSTLNRDDRWPDVLARRLHAVHGNRIAVVNAGIGGNQIAGPKEYSPAIPFPGGPSAAARLERDVLSLSGVQSVIWLEGINDFRKSGNAPVEPVQAVMRESVARMRARGVRVIGATLTPALGATNPNHGFAEQDDKRRALNDFIRNSGLFDAVVDFDAVITNPATGAMKPQLVHNTTTGGDGDWLHPNRLGYLAMGMAIDLNLIRENVGQ